MATLTSRASRLLPCAALVLLGACARGSQDEMSWARAALARNARIEVVASDMQTRTFTVRVKDSGEVRIVRVDELVVEPLAATAPAAAAAAAGVAAASEDTHEVTAATAAADAAASAAPASPETAAAPVAPSAAPAAHAGGAHVLETGPGYSIEAASGTQAAHLESGPGYSIKPSPGSTSGAGSRASLRDAGITSAAIERRREPIICQGSRLLHIDNRNLEFDGDAVSAEDGCEIHITNSHITATGVGVLARNANVHIDNSLIEGDAGSITSSDGAQVYAADSHFRGLSRRADSATFHDLGGNIWN